MHGKVAISNNNISNCKQCCIAINQMNLCPPIYMHVHGYAIGREIYCIVATYVLYVLLECFYVYYIAI